MGAPSSTSHIFVYGTLRREAPMHALLGDGARFVGAARFQGRLWDFGAYPGVTDSSRRHDQVHGELYELTGGDRDGVLERLDRYEGEGFERALREVVTGDGRRYDAFVFLFLGSTRRARRIASGDYVQELRRGAPATRLG